MQPKDLNFENLTLDYRDNVLPISDRQCLFSDFIRESFQLGWKDAEFEKEVFLHSFLGGSRACRLLRSYVESIWSERLAGYKHVNTVLNLGLPGSIYKSHADDVYMNKSTVTVLYMGNLKWEHGWGGETKFYDPYTRELKWVSEYTPGRFIIFDGNIHHSAGIIAYHADFFRFTTAIMYSNDPVENFEGAEHVMRYST